MRAQEHRKVQHVVQRNDCLASYVQSLVSLLLDLHQLVTFFVLVSLLRETTIFEEVGRSRLLHLFPLRSPVNIAETSLDVPLVQLSDPTTAELLDRAGESVVVEDAIDAVVVERLFFDFTSVLLADRRT